MDKIGANAQRGKSTCHVQPKTPGRNLRLNMKQTKYDLRSLSFQERIIHRIVNTVRIWDHTTTGSTQKYRTGTDESTY